MRIKSGAVGFGTARFYLHLLPGKWKWALQGGFEQDVLAGIGALNARNRAVGAQGWTPGESGRLQQAAFLAVAPTIIVTIEKPALLAGRCSHVVQIPFREGQETAPDILREPEKVL
jgi:hypothetical protein